MCYTHFANCHHIITQFQVASASAICHVFGKHSEAGARKRAQLWRSSVFSPPDRVKIVCQLHHHHLSRAISFARSLSSQIDVAQNARHTFGRESSSFFQIHFFLKARKCSTAEKKWKYIISLWKLKTTTIKISKYTQPVLPVAAGNLSLFVSSFSN